MAELILPHDLANQTQADATEPEGNFNVIQNYVNQEVIRRDGVNAMEAQLTLAGDPVEDNDAARKAYVDAVLPVGIILPYAGTSAPPGEWSLCAGGSLSTSSYTELFALIGFTYGGSGGSFLLPDMRGLIPVCLGTTSPFNALNGKSGNKDAPVVAHTHDISHTHAASTSGTSGADHTHSNSHQHPATTTGAGTAHSHGPGTGTLFFTRTATGGGLAVMDNTALPNDEQWHSPTTTASESSHTHSIPMQDFSGNTGTASVINHQHTTPALAHAGSSGAATGGESATNRNMPPYIVINYIIRLR